MILPIKHLCRPNEYQDTKHPGWRVFNPVNKSIAFGRLREVRCTVCGKNQSV